MFLGPDFITVTKEHDDIQWQILKPEIYAAIMDFFSTNLPILNENAPPPESSKLRLVFGIDHRSKKENFSQVFPLKMMIQLR